MVHLCLLCASCAGRMEVYGTAPALDDGACAEGDLVRGGDARAGTRGVEASQTCGLGHHRCGAGHPV